MSRLYALGGGILLLLIVLGAWQHRVAQLAAARADLATCNARYAALDKQVEAQNATIADYRHKADEQRKAVETAQAQAQAQLQQAQRRLQRVLTAQVPAECSAAVAWTREQAADIGARWARSAP